jgi:hypothetical protein
LLLVLYSLRFKIKSYVSENLWALGHILHF